MEKKAVGNGFRWEDNVFWKDIASRLDKLWGGFSGIPMREDGGSGCWAQACSPTGASQVALLQNRYAALDITDRGICVCPMVLGGRYYLRAGFDIADASGAVCTHPWESRDAGGLALTALYRPGRFELSGKTAANLEFTLSACMPPDFPFLILDLTVRGARGDLKISPWLLWMPGESSPVGQGALWLAPRSAEPEDKVLANNNSKTADPPREDSGAPSGVGIAIEGRGVLKARRDKAAGGTDSSITLCSWTFPANDVEKLEFSPIICDSGRESAGCTMILGFYADAGEFQDDVDRWNGLSAGERHRQRAYWDQIVNALSVHCGDKDIERQAKYSVHNSLFSRCVYERGGEIFIHGRPDHGYGDCAKLHQSYQMHYVALASGQAASVKGELLAFAARQNPNGDMAVQLKPGGGAHPYAGLYSNAHFVLALHRYLAWTGDFGMLSEQAKPGETVLECAIKAASWLLENMEGGLVKPCGWLDAWPPRVKAQAQISICSLMAFRELAEILGHIGDKEGEARFRGIASRLGQRIMQVFYNEENGLFSEHLFESGEIKGGETPDFWAHTQIWAALAGLAPDGRGLDACKEYCLKSGMIVIPESGMGSGYIADSTDGQEDLSLWSTATWLLAAWPELTHLWALACIRYGRPEDALNAVRGQLPVRMHEANPHASPFYYAEKYLYPYDKPWLCTWSGDPTLLQALLEGFAGIEVSLEGLRIRPNVPPALCRDGIFSMDFIWRNRKISLDIRNNGKTIEKFSINGMRAEPDEVIARELLGDANSIQVRLG